MKFKKLLTLSVVIFAGLTFYSSTYAQIMGNTVSGHVFGHDRQPIYDANVELLDDLNRFIQRSRTDSSGRYFFSGVRSGRFTIRVMPYETDYQDQEESIEIVNFNRQLGADGPIQASGFDNVQRDFYLKLRRGATGTTGTIYVQEVPADAKKLYEKAIADLNNKKEKEGLAGLIAAIEKFPKYFHALERLGNEYVRLKHYEAAMILLKNAIDVNARSFRSWYGYAFSLNALNQDVEALKSVQKALEIYAESPEALLLSGVLLRQAKKIEEAEKNLLKAKELAKNRLPDVHYHLALLYGNDLKRYADAAKELKLYLKAQPDNVNVENVKKLIATFEEKAKTEAPSKTQ